MLKSISRYLKVVKVRFIEALAAVHLPSFFFDELLEDQVGGHFKGLDSTCYCGVEGDSSSQDYSVDHIRN